MSPTNAEVVKKFTSGILNIHGVLLRVIPGRRDIGDKFARVQINGIGLTLMQAEVVREQITNAIRAARVLNKESIK